MGKRCKISVKQRSPFVGKYLINLIAQQIQVIRFKVHCQRWALPKSLLMYRFGTYCLVSVEDFEAWTITKRNKKQLRWLSLSPWPFGGPSIPPPLSNSLSFIWWLKTHSLSKQTGVFQNGQYHNIWNLNTLFNRQNIKEISSFLNLVFWTEPS